MEATRHDFHRFFFGVWGNTYLQEALGIVSSKVGLSQMFLGSLGLHPEAGTSTGQVYRLVRERKIHLAEAAGSNVAAS